MDRRRLTHDRADYSGPKPPRTAPASSIHIGLSRVAGIIPAAAIVRAMALQLVSAARAITAPLAITSPMTTGPEKRCLRCGDQILSLRG
jgi:hypothetical protein